jgi:hypothetical protein
MTSARDIEGWRREVKRQSASLEGQLRLPGLDDCRTRAECGKSEFVDRRNGQMFLGFEDNERADDEHDTGTEDGFAG